MEDKEWNEKNLYEQVAYFLEGRMNPGKLLREAGEELKECRKMYEEALHLISDLVKQRDELQKKIDVLSSGSKI